MFRARRRSRMSFVNVRRRKTTGYFGRTGGYSWLTSREAVNGRYSPYAACSHATDRTLGCLLSAFVSRLRRNRLSLFHWHIRFTPKRSPSNAVMHDAFGPWRFLVPSGPGCFKTFMRCEESRKPRSRYNGQESFDTKARPISNVGQNTLN